MRLTQTLNEARTPVNEIINLDDLNERINKYCKSYLRLIKGKYPLYRGMAPAEASNGEIYRGMKGVRKDRTPYGMSKIEAQALNAMLQKNGHARRDRSVLVTSDKHHVDMFGSAYWVFPKDKMKYTWVETKDINLEDNHSGFEMGTVEAWMYDEYDDDRFGDRHQKILDRLHKPFKDHFHTNKGFKDAYNGEYEMWIECDAYYFAKVNRHRWFKDKQLLG